MKRQRASPEETSNQGDVARKGLVSLNKLDYVLQPDLSVCVSRSYKKHFFQQKEYLPGQRAICILNSGAEYTDPQNSYLSFTVHNEGSGPAIRLEKTGSAINLIQKVILTSRSGDEIERVENVHQLAPVLDRYQYGDNWLKTVGKVIGYDNLSANGVTIADGSKKTFVIPLGCITGLFRSFDRLLPSMLMSGLRIEIEFNPAIAAFSRANAGVVAYKILEPEITLDQYQLTDAIMRVLNEEAAMRGLEVVFTSYYNHIYDLKSADKANIEVRKAVSRALGVVTKLNQKIGTDATKDYIESENFNLAAYQIRLGSLYFPQQPIKSLGGVNGALEECYVHTMRGFGKLKTPNAPPEVTPATYQSHLGAMYTDLERSTVQRLSGVPVNNSRVAEVMLNLTGTLTNTTEANIWLHYVRLLRVFIQNVEIEE